MKELKMLSKEKALELINQAKNEIETEGESSLQLVINRRHKEHSFEDIVEVGILVDKSDDVPSSRNLMVLKRGDDLLKAITNYEKAIAKVS